MRLSTAGLGPATFGMTLQQVEAALETRIPVDAKQVSALARCRASRRASSQTQGFDMLE